MDVELTINLVLDGETEAVLEGYVIPVGQIYARVIGERISSDDGQWKKYESTEFSILQQGSKPWPFDKLRKAFNDVSKRHDYRNLRFSVRVATNWDEEPALDLLSVVEDRLYPPTNTN